MIQEQKYGGPLAPEYCLIVRVVGDIRMYPSQHMASKTTIGKMGKLLYSSK